MVDYLNTVKSNSLSTTNLSILDKQKIQKTHTFPVIRVKKKKKRAKTGNRIKWISNSLTKFQLYGDGFFFFFSSSRNLLFCEILT